RKAIRLSRDRLLDISRILVEVWFATRNDLRDDREAVAGRGLREDRTIAAMLDLVLEVSAFRDRHRRGFRPVVLFGCVCHFFLPSLWLAIAYCWYSVLLYHRRSEEHT